jgi:hypothetical protein
MTHIDANKLRDIIKEEYKRCALDAGYFLRKYCVIQHPKRGKIAFNLYPFQQKTLNTFSDNDYCIVLKARQIGLSTLVAGYALWIMLFQADKNVLVIATKQDTAKNMVTKVRVMHQNLPSWLRGTCIEDNKLSLRFKNGSQIKAVSSSTDSARSEALSLLILDEAAFIENIDLIWDSAWSTLSTGGKAILLSTPNGIGNFFHKKWVEATEKPDSLFTPIFLDWRVHPDRDQEWRDKQTEALGDKGARQEHDADFLATGNAVIDPDITKWYRETYEREPLEYRGFDKNYWIWRYPDASKTYIVVADVSRGDATDFSAFHVFDIDACEQVAEYKGRLDTADFGNMLYAVATDYNDALLIVENANIGWAVIQKLIDRNYKNLYYTEKDIHYTDPDREYLSKSYSQIEKTKVAGFTTSVRTRPLIISKLDEYMRDGYNHEEENVITIYSKRFYDELDVFIWNGSKAEAMEGYNDDLVMAMSITLWIRDTALKLRQQGIELTRVALDNISQVRAPQDAIYTSKSKTAVDQYKMIINGEEEDLKWLLG